MFRQVVLLAFVIGLPAFAGRVQLLSSLPAGSTSTTMQLDAAGNIYLAGNTAASQAFVAKVSADGSKVVYFTILSSATAADTAAGIALGSDGSVYVAGSTTDAGFPVTAGAFETTLDPAGVSQGFLVKVNPAGTVVYSTYINGKTYTQLTGLAIDGAGEILLTGSGGPAYPVTSSPPVQGFIVKLDAGLSKLLLSIYGYGGGLIALDGQSNIYIAGSAQPVNVSGQFLSLPPLPAGAFQATHLGAVCQASTGPGGPFEKLCPHQYVAKLDATGKPLWATYVTGTYGETAAGLAVDSAGNVIVAGTTNSSDYPVTAGAFQTSYPAAAAPLPGAGFVFIAPPDATGYVTKVNATGTGLVWSTYFGGSSQDQITGMAVNAAGDIILSGRTASNDLFLADTPGPCRPTPNQVLGFVARLIADGSAVSATQPVEGVPDCLYLSCNIGLAVYRTGWPVAVRADGTVAVAGANGSVAAVDFNSSSRVACVTDPADNAQLSSVAPGQLISLFGADLVEPGAPFRVLFNGIAAPILYSAAQQINVQVPFEIGSTGIVQMQVMSQAISETDTLQVAAREPAAFLSAAALESTIPGWSMCGQTQALGQAAAALNTDGSVNDCSNPAAVGSTVTVFLNGFGATTPVLSTGAIPEGPAIPLMIPFDPGTFTGTTLFSGMSLAGGGSSGVAQLKLKAGGGGGKNVLLNGPALAGTPLRERLILIWTR